MTKFSANLGFLWSELPLPDAVRAAARAGFDAVECHWPYDTPTEVLNAALTETGLRMLSLNTLRGNVQAGEIGLSALPGREAEARAAIDQAIGYAQAINTPNIHVMAGIAQGEKAHDTFISNLAYATDSANAANITILIEPLNHFDAPGFFLQNSTQAQVIVEQLAVDNLKLMFDCYHLQIMEGDISRRIKNLLPIIGHIQIASVPDRAEPDQGELDYQHVLCLLQSIDYDAPIGAEYRPRVDTEAGLSWMTSLLPV